MSTTTQVHNPLPLQPGMLVDGDDGPFVAFTFDDVRCYVSDPDWFAHVALWASREAVRLREAQPPAVEVCVSCGGDNLPFVLRDGLRTCTRCATQQVAS